MKHRFTLLFALLCASMMTWAAIDWNAVEFLGSTEPSISMNTYKYAVDTEAGEQGPNTIANIQDADGRLGFYSTYGQGISSCSHEGKILEDQLWLYVDQLTAKDTKITVTLADASVRTFHMWYISGTEGESGGEGGEGGEEPDPTPEPGVTGICNATYASNQDGYAVKATVTKGCNRYYLTLTSAVEGKVLTGLSGANMHCTPYGNAASTQALPNYHMAAAGRYTIEDGTITFCIPSIGAPKMYTPLYLQFDNVGTEHTINGLNNVPLEVCSTEPAANCPDPEPTEIWDMNFALMDNGALATSNATSGMPHLAINGNEGDAWDSNHGVDAIDWIVDLGQRRIFNTVNIFWSNAWGKSFDIQVSNNEEDWTTVKEIRDQTTSNGSMQVITFDKTTARYVRFHGISRGTIYGYGFYEFQVLLPGVSTLTTIDLKATATIAKIDGDGLTLTTAAKDQNSNPMSEIEITYEVTPTGAGNVDNGKYIPAQYGWATIVAKSGEVTSDAIQVFGVNSDNLALSTNIDTDNKVIDQSEITGDANNAFYAVDGNKGNVWQACRNLADNNSNVEFTSHFTLDLGNTYAINLIAIWFDGAASDDYKIEFSADNTTWKEGFRIQQSIGNYLHQKYLTNSELSNNDQARYLRFTTYKASTQNGWGLKIFEFEVYGTEASTTKNVSASVSDENRGTAVVKKGDEVVSSVETGTEVTFIATAKEGYEFVNWTQGSTVVSTEANYTTTITANTALVANFDHIRYAYCHTPVQTSGGYKVYLTVGKGATEGTYQVTIEGSEELTITGINNANTAMNNVKFGAQDGNDVSFTKENNGWTFSDTGYGVITSAEIQPRTGYTWKDMWMWRPDLYIGTNQGEQNINGVLAKYFIWDNDCADTESPIFNTLNANVINETTIQLVMKATDNWDGMLTYTIAREGAEDITLQAVSGEVVAQEITGLTAGTEYTFNITVSDGKFTTNTSLTATPLADEVKPVMKSATLESKTWNNAVIAVVATDNKAVVAYHLVDATNSINAEFEAVDGKINLVELTEATDYSFTITAKDAAGNESENNMVVSFTTQTLGIDLALNKEVEASGHDNVHNPELAPELAVDNDEGSFWSAFAGETGEERVYDAWILVDLGGFYDINMISIRWEGACSKAYHVDFSANKTDWRVAYNAGWDAVATHWETLTGTETDNTKVRYVRVWSTEAVSHWGIKIMALRVYGVPWVPEGDNEKPVMGAASLASNTYNSAIINVAATDNTEIKGYRVVDTTNGIDAEFTSKNGQITITGLTPSTTYNFTITAIDAASNESENSANVAVTTASYSATPLTAAPVPTWPAAQVKSLYSNTYPFAPASLNSYNEGWWAAPAMTEGNVDGNTYLYYTLANDGMIGWQYAETSVASMENLHIDIWASASGTISIRPITNGGPETRKSLTLVAQQWNSFDIPMTDFPGHDWTKLFQFAIEYWNAGGLTGEYIAVDNVYFYRETPIVDDVVPTNLTVSVNKESFYSIALDVQAEDNMAAVAFSIKNGETEVATGAAASGATTTITVNNLTPNTNYTFTVIAKDEAGNAAEPKSVTAKTLAVPAPAPAPTYPADLVKSLYSNAYAPAATLGDTNENWWQAPTNSEVNLGEGDMALLYENIPATSSFGWAFSTFDAIGYQTLHMSIYPLNSGTIEIYPVIQPEGEFHRTSQTLVANQWNDVVIDFSDKTFTTFVQLGFTNFSALGAFFIDNVYFTCPIATTTVDGWATFASAGNVQVPAGAKAYKAAYSNNGGNEVLVLTELADGIIPAGEGVLINGDASTTYGFTSAVSAPTTDMTDNDLIGTTTLTDVSAQRATSDIFCLRRTELFGTTAFCLYSGQYIPAGKAYLALPQINGQAGAPRNIRMVFNTATGIEDVQGTQVQSTKVIENGQLIIIRDGKRYNAQGARVE